MASMIERDETNNDYVANKRFINFAQKKLDCFPFVVSFASLPFAWRAYGYCREQYGEEALISKHGEIIYRPESHWMFYLTTLRFKDARAATLVKLQFGGRYD